MKYFDLHCDTLYRALTENKSLYDNDFHISLKKGLDFDCWIQCFALWIPDDVSSDTALNMLQRSYELLSTQIAKHSDDIILCKSKSDIENVVKTKKSGAIFTIENASVLDGKTENLSLLKQMGVKVLTLTWNAQNCVGSGIASNPDSGITAFGKAVISQMEKFGIVPDISHASEKLFYDVFAQSTAPIIATHSNSKTVCSHRRNLTDEQFKMIQKRNGIVGLNFCKSFLNNDGSKADIEDILRHAEYFLSLGGENTVCVGSDFDGADMSIGVKDINSIYEVANCLLRHNYSETLLNKILFLNAYNFFTRVM